MKMYKEEKKKKKKKKKMELKQQIYEEKQKRKFKAKKVPEFAKLQTEFEEKLKAMKDQTKRQRKNLKPIPFLHFMNLKKSCRIMSIS